MNNLALYRKYRPKTFKEIIGQEHIVKTLTNAISSGIISHAYLFSGPYGTGKTTMARLLAKALNCCQRQQSTINKQQITNKELGVGKRRLKVGVSPEPCNKCSSCLEINQARSIDLIEIDAASHRGIDEIRELREGIRFVPTKSKYKVFIIDEASQLTKEAANALLKILEEPPSHAIFILATTEAHKMIPTIISRCQRFDFWKLSLSQIIKRLEIISQKEKVKIEKQALEIIALNSKGSIRDAEGFLDRSLAMAGILKKDKEIKTEDIKQFLGIIDIRLIAQMIDFILEKKGTEAINFLNEIIKKGNDIQEFSKSLINYLRQCLIFKIVGLQNKEDQIITGFTEEEFEKFQIQARAFEEKELNYILNLFLEAEDKMKYSPIPQLPLELVIIEITQKER